MTPSRLLLLSPSFNKQDVPAPLPVIINQPTPSLRGRRNERLRRLDQTRREPLNLLSPTDQERSRSGRLTGRIDQPLAFAIRSTSPFRYLGPGSPNNPAGLSPVCTTKAVSFTTQCSFRFVSSRGDDPWIPIELLPIEDYRSSSHGNVELLVFEKGNCELLDEKWMDVAYRELVNFIQIKNLSVSSTWFWIGLGWKKELTSNSWSLYELFDKSGGMDRIVLSR